MSFKLYQEEKDISKIGELLLFLLRDIRVYYIP